MIFLDRLDSFLEFFSRCDEKTVQKEIMKYVRRYIAAATVAIDAAKQIEELRLRGLLRFADAISQLKEEAKTKFGPALTGVQRKIEVLNQQRHNIHLRIGQDSAAAAQLRQRFARVMKFFQLYYWEDDLCPHPDAGDPELMRFLPPPFRKRVVPGDPGVAGGNPPPPPPVEDDEPGVLVEPQNIPPWFAGLENLRELDLTDPKTREQMLKVRKFRFPILELHCKKALRAIGWLGELEYEYVIFFGRTERKKREIALFVCPKEGHYADYKFLILKRARTRARRMLWAVEGQWSRKRVREEARTFLPPKVVHEGDVVARERLWWDTH